MSQGGLGGVAVVGPFAEALMEDLEVDEAVLKLKDSARSKLTLIEIAIVLGIFGTFVFGCLSFVWLLFVSAVLITQKVLGI